MLDFGDLRSAVHAARTHPERVDAVVWCVLMAPEGAKAAWHKYALDNLEGVRRGTVELGLLLGWCVDGEEALVARGKLFVPPGADALDGFRVLVREFLSAWAWGVVHNPLVGPRVERIISGERKLRAGTWEERHIEFVRRRNSYDRPRSQARPQEARSSLMVTEWPGLSKHLHPAGAKAPKPWGRRRRT